jgi:hypothetical protein
MTISSSVRFTNLQNLPKKKAILPHSQRTRTMKNLLKDENNECMSLWKPKYDPHCSIVRIAPLCKFFQRISLKLSLTNNNNQAPNDSESHQLQVFFARKDKELKALLSCFEVKIFDDPCASLKANRTIPYKAHQKATFQFSINEMHKIKIEFSINNLTLCIFSIHLKLSKFLDQHLKGSSIFEFWREISTTLECKSNRHSNKNSLWIKNRISRSLYKRTLNNHNVQAPFHWYDSRKCLTTWVNNLYQMPPIFKGDSGFNTGYG